MLISWGIFRYALVLQASLVGGLLAGIGVYAIKNGAGFEASASFLFPGNGDTDSVVIIAAAAVFIIGAIVQLAVISKS